MLFLQAILGRFADLISGYAVTPRNWWGDENNTDKKKRDSAVLFCETLRKYAAFPREILYSELSGRIESDAESVYDEHLLSELLPQMKLQRDNVKQIDEASSYSILLEIFVTVFPKAYEISAFSKLDVLPEAEEQLPSVLARIEVAKYLVDIHLDEVTDNKLNKTDYFKKFFSWPFETGSTYFKNAILSEKLEQLARNTIQELSENPALSAPQVLKILKSALDTDKDLREGYKPGRLTEYLEGAKRKIEQLPDYNAYLKELDQKQKAQAVLAEQKLHIVMAKYPKLSINKQDKFEQDTSSSDEESYSSDEQSNNRKWGLF